MFVPHITPSHPPTIHCQSNMPTRDMRKGQRSSNDVVEKLKSPSENQSTRRKNHAFRLLMRKNISKHNAQEQSTGVDNNVKTIGLDLPKKCLLKTSKNTVNTVLFAF